MLSESCQVKRCITPLSGFFFFSYLLTSFSICMQTFYCQVLDFSQIFQDGKIIVLFRFWVSSLPSINFIVYYKFSACFKNKRHRSFMIFFLTYCLLHLFFYRPLLHVEILFSWPLDFLALLIVDLFHINFLLFPFFFIAHSWMSSDVHFLNFSFLCSFLKVLFWIS